MSGEDTQDNNRITRLAELETCSEFN